MESGDPEARWRVCWGIVGVSHLVRATLRKEFLRGLEAFRIRDCVG